MSDEVEHEEFTPQQEDIWQADWEATLGDDDYRQYTACSGDTMWKCFGPFGFSKWKFRRPIKWSEPFRLKAGERRPDVYQFRSSGNRWLVGVRPGVEVNTWDAVAHEYRVPLTAAKPPAPEPVMTPAIWDSMSVEQRREWNRPAYDALGIPTKVVEFLVDGTTWYSSGDSVGLGSPHRVKPTPPAKPRYWLHVDEVGWEVVQEDCEPEARHGIKYVELVEKGSAE